MGKLDRKQEKWNMARPYKTGLDYFELDCNLDEKIRLIQAEYGLKGFAVVVLFFKEIYGGQGYYMSWDRERLLLLVSENGIADGDANLIWEISQACIRRGIFSAELFEKYQILTSKGIQKRYFRAVARRGKVEAKKEYLLIKVTPNSVNVDKNPVNVNKNPINADKSTQRREEKRKEENRKACASLLPERAEEDEDEGMDPMELKTIWDKMQKEKQRN